MPTLKESRAELGAFGAWLGGSAQADLQEWYRNGNSEEEEALTGMLCGLLVAKQPRPGKADSPAAHGLDVAVVHKKNEEYLLGADLAIVFESWIPHWELRTRTLLQAKRAEPGQRMRTREWQRMHAQARTMLRHVRESFVLAYSLEEESCVFPALSAASCGSRDLFDLDWYSFQGFMEGIFCGFIGEALGEEEGGGEPGGRKRSLARHEIRILVQQEQPGDLGGSRPPTPVDPVGGQRVAEAAWQ